MLKLVKLWSLIFIPTLLHSIIYTYYFMHYKYFYINKLRDVFFSQIRFDYSTIIVYFFCFFFLLLIKVKWYFLSWKVQTVAVWYLDFIYNSTTNSLTTSCKSLVKWNIVANCMQLMKIKDFNGCEVLHILTNSQTSLSIYFIVLVV